MAPQKRIPRGETALWAIAAGLTVVGVCRFLASRGQPAAPTKPRRASRRSRDKECDDAVVESRTEAQPVDSEPSLPSVTAGKLGQALLSLEPAQSGSPKSLMHWESGVTVEEDSPEPAQRQALTVVFETSAAVECYRLHALWHHRFANGVDVTTVETFTISLPPFTTLLEAWVRHTAPVKTSSPPPLAGPQELVQASIETIFAGSDRPDALLLEWKPENPAAVEIEDIFVGNAAAAVEIIELPSSSPTFRAAVKDVEVNNWQLTVVSQQRPPSLLSRTPVGAKLVAISDAALWALRFANAYQGPTTARFGVVTLDPSCLLEAWVLRGGTTVWLISVARSMALPARPMATIDVETVDIDPAAAAAALQVEEFYAPAASSLVGEALPNACYLAIEWKEPVKRMLNTAEKMAVVISRCDAATVIGSWSEAGRAGGKLPALERQLMTLVALCPQVVVEYYVPALRHLGAALDRLRASPGVGLPKLRKPVERLPALERKLVKTVSFVDLMASSPKMLDSEKNRHLFLMALRHLVGLLDDVAACKAPYRNQAQVVVAAAHVLGLLHAILEERPELGAGHLMDPYNVKPAIEEKVHPVVQHAEIIYDLVVSLLNGGLPSGFIEAMVPFGQDRVDAGLAWARRAAKDGTTVVHMTCRFVVAEDERYPVRMQLAGKRLRQYNQYFSGFKSAGVIGMSLPASSPPPPPPPAPAPAPQASRGGGAYSGGSAGGASRGYYSTAAPPPGFSSSPSWGQNGGGPAPSAQSWAGAGYARSASSSSGGAGGSHGGGATGWGNAAGGSAGAGTSWGAATSGGWNGGHGAYHGYHGEVPPPAPQPAPMAWASGTFMDGYQEPAAGSNAGPQASAGYHGHGGGPCHAGGSAAPPPAAAPGRPSWASAAGW